MSEFVPFDATANDLEARRVLRDGVPASMRGALESWAWNRVQDRGNGRLDRPPAVENNCELQLGLTGVGRFVREEDVYTILGNLTARDLLNVCHYQLHRSGAGMSENAAVWALSGLLTAGRSKWTVGQVATGGWGLVERVLEGIQAAAEALIAQGGSAGQLLGKAWADVHDLTPNDSAAYANAVKAIEAAALSALSITGDTATMGNAIRTLDDSDSWRLQFRWEHTQAPSRAVLAGLLRSLWRGHRDRHFSEAYEGVTHDETLATVLMAVTLVGCADGGHIGRLVRWRTRTGARHPGLQLT